MTFVTGFLGSGKSRLIDHILQQTSQATIHCPVTMRSAVILTQSSDEFGLTVDSDHFVESGGASGVLVLQCKEDLWNPTGGGCKCCDNSPELISIMEQVVGECVDHLIVETTGVPCGVDVLLGM